ncbi:hypothetical protein Pmani_001001 [Petrolisthes manimaculis]|uniref:Uncharacterized protein n=1 Tax=Petrolisthes manimaculis TaxID=1843537 RepID=A0AAE1QKE7_9EUCA|nr:hypothetical protein Pmani_001001 [Petrolisthes manimaculis]
MARQNSPDFQQLLDGYIIDDLSDLDLESDEDTENDSSERGESSDNSEQADDPCIARQRKRTRGGEAVTGGPGGVTRVRGAAAGRNSWEEVGLVFNSFYT